MHPTVKLWLTGKYTLQEIADKCGCSKSKVKTDIDKYLKSLKKKK